MVMALYALDYFSGVPPQGYEQPPAWQNSVKSLGVVFTWLARSKNPPFCTFAETFTGHIILAISFENEAFGAMFTER